MYMYVLSSCSHKLGHKLRDNGVSKTRIRIGRHAGQETGKEDNRSGKKTGGSKASDTHTEAEGGGKNTKIINHFPTSYFNFTILYGIQ